MARSKIRVPDLLARKAQGPKIVAVTAYDATFARLMDTAEVDILLVGDSLGMVIQGHSTTLPVTLEEIGYHSRAVARSEPSAHLVGDLPFLSYQTSVADAVRSGGYLLKEGGCESVKLEGGESVAEQVRALVSAGIPVMGHLGLTPQSVHRLGGFRVQGREPGEADRMLRDARALEAAGAYAIVLESVPTELARTITEQLRIPTIGIGAGPHCDGQVLVCYDLLGLEDRLRPKFVKRYSELGQQVVSATRAFATEVQNGRFPGPEHSYGTDGAVRHEMATLPEISSSRNPIPSTH